MPGPLEVSVDNPRYFTVRSDDPAGRRVVYLTGSHIWNNFHDGMGPGATAPALPEKLDYDSYLDFLAAHGHNFIRLWRWEQFKSQAAGGAYHLNMSPQPWPRTGQGTAKDGGPKFDLSQFDPAYFRRLRERVIAAGERGMYVAVMLFEGWALHLSPAPDNVEGHPCHAASNVNGIGITSILDHQVLPLDPAVRALQEAYIQQVVDTVHDLPNVLYEVANESCGGGTADPEMAAVLGVPPGTEWGDSTDWQYWVIEFVRQYERQEEYDPHPIGMTMQFPVADQTRVNAPLFDGPADWISPGYDDEIFREGGHPAAPDGPPSRWLENPPPADGRKVLISDTDHFAPGQGDALWVWKAFLRGHNPILMDFGLIDGIQPAGEPSPDAFEPARQAMGDTRRYAERIDLIGMPPRGDLSSTGYVLAHPGKEYLILQPSETSEVFTAELLAGSYTAHWYAIGERTSRTGDEVTVPSDGLVKFTMPSTIHGPAVLHLAAATNPVSAASR
ncbi:hypothetical protein ITP53_41055 [Nonomuraea sp. K274]|uniref:Uncharacterized protein n=1 Tax=Nonomuraea cypriaca TaxID=1187855 RepID=A0A931AFW9_9ACTN|nr:hypothetical protein [Nonomuraea cypriaca]MBF8191966.1 hypothetical protein [Nonomuraea cypriaca]